MTKPSIFREYLKILRKYNIPAPDLVTFHNLSRQIGNHFATLNDGVVYPDCIGTFEVNMLCCYECECSDICEICTFGDLE